MTVSTYVIIEQSECTRCAACDRPLSIGDTAHELDGRPFCGPACAFEYVGRAMTRLHGGESRKLIDSDGMTREEIRQLYDGD